MSKTKSPKNKNSQKRIEYRGENVRVSRTGGVAVTKTFKKDGGWSNPKYKTWYPFAQTAI